MSIHTPVFDSKKQSSFPCNWRRFRVLLKHIVLSKLDSPMFGKALQEKPVVGDLEIKVVLGHLLTIKSDFRDFHSTNPER